MKQIIYAIRFFSEWHCGSGLSAGSDLDSLVIKDRNWLPYIPGKTLKGILREAAEYLLWLTGDAEWEKFCRTCFGHKTDEAEEHGTCHFSNAELSANLRQYIISSDCSQQTLYRKIASTAIDQDGQAQEHSLRRMEVTVPLTLFAEISHCSHVDKMEQCMQWVKRLGVNRNRGFGRCDLKIKEVQG